VGEDREVIERFTDWGGIDVTTADVVGKNKAKKGEKMELDIS
jgi:predicted aconitase with swiveling domain